MFKRAWVILLLGIIGQFAFMTRTAVAFAAPNWGWGCGMSCMSAGGGPFGPFYGLPFGPWAAPPYGTGQWMWRPNPMGMYMGAYPAGMTGAMGPMYRMPYAGGAIID